MTEQRWVATVNPELMLALVDLALNDEAIAHRFWSKVDRSAGDDGCWIWTAALSSEGYGAFKVIIDGRHHTVRAHRMAWFLVHLTPLEADHYLDHLADRCRGRWCVNPSHLEPVTKAENDRRATGAGRAIQRTTRDAEMLARGLVRPVAALQAV